MAQLNYVSAERYDAIVRMLKRANDLRAKSKQGNLTLQEKLNILAAAKAAENVAHDLAGRD